jgi:hypothetical protein
MTVDNLTNLKNCKANRRREVEDPTLKGLVASPAGTLFSLKHTTRVAGMPPCQFSWGDRVFFPLCSAVLLP